MASRSSLSLPQITMLLLLLLSSVSAQKVINLSGSDWTLQNLPLNISVPGSVPSQVHLDLYAAQVIGDPYETKPPPSSSPQLHRHFWLGDLLLMWGRYGLDILVWMTFLCAGLLIVIGPISLHRYLNCMPSPPAPFDHLPLFTIPSTNPSPPSPHTHTHIYSSNWYDSGGELLKTCKKITKPKLNTPLTYRSQTSRAQTWLLFNGLDTFTSIEFCGEHVAATNNQFRQYYFDISDLVRDCCIEEQVLSINFGSAPRIADGIAQEPGQESM